MYISILEDSSFCKAYIHTYIHTSYIHTYIIHTGKTTDRIPFNAKITDLQKYIEALPTLGTG